MKKEEFAKGFKFLNVAYNKDFNDDQITVWYDFFKDKDYETFRIAVKNIITKNKYMPSISELINEINFLKAQEIIDYMNRCGQSESFKKKKVFYFSCDEEIIKSISDIIKIGYTIDEIKIAITKAYEEFIEQKEEGVFYIENSNDSYNPSKLFDLTPGKNIIYFLNS